MASGIVALEKLQFGIETVAGTIVAADTVLVAEGGGNYQPQIDRRRIDDREGLLVPAVHLDVMKGTLLSYRHALDYEQILLPLLTGLDTVAGAGTGPYTYTFTPSPTAPAGVDSASFEVSYYDGSTRHLQREMGFGTCSRFAISAPFNQQAMIEADFFARAPQTSTFTAGQSKLTRELIPSNLFGLYIDTTWANLGTTQKTGIIRDFRYEMQTGCSPGYTLDQRTDLDMTKLNRGPISGQVELVLEYAADGDAEYDAWEAGTRRFVSLEAAGSGSRSLKLQACIELSANPTFGETPEGLRMMTLVGEMVYDTTSGNFASIEVVNNLASL